MNAKDFARVLEQVAQSSSRTYPEFVNGQGLRLASLATVHTKKASASALSAFLGQTSSRITNLRTGRRLKTAKKVFSSKASLDLYRIVNWRRLRGGKRALGGKEMSKVARKFRAAVLRSTGYISSGWIWAVKTLSRQVGYRDLTPNTIKPPKLNGAAKGYAIPARFTLNGVVVCEIGNTSLIETSAPRTGSRKGNPMPVAERGLAIARDLTAKDMLAHLARKLQPVLDKHSAK